MTLTDGIYTYACDPHFTVMKGAFAVGAAALPPAVTPTLPTPASAAVRLSGAVTRTGISLTTSAGTPARSTGAGPYEITIRDGSRLDDFHLTGPGVDRRTSIRGTGTVTWRAFLRRGRYVYRSDTTPAHRGRLEVTR